jgi:chorismate mutase
MSMRGIRGAITVKADTSNEILAATRELLQAVLQANPELKPQDICSIFFTMTPDLHAVHPALAARQMGWVEVPLLCAQEIPVPDSVPRCIRVLVHWNTDKPQNEVCHVYLGEASVLRPDLVDNKQKWSIVGSS